MYNKKQVMKTAWDLAKRWANNKGGKAIDYIGAALKQAWKVIKTTFNSLHGLYGVEGNTITLAGSNRQPMYLAIVDGLSEKFGLNRKFVPAPHRGTVDHTFDLEEGVFYNWSETKGAQYFGQFKNGRMIPMTKEEVTALFA